MLLYLTGGIIAFIIVVFFGLDLFEKFKARNKSKVKSEVHYNKGTVYLTYTPNDHNIKIEARSNYSQLNGENIYFIGDAQRISIRIIKELTETIYTNSYGTTSSGESFTLYNTGSYEAFTGETVISVTQSPKNGSEDKDIVAYCVVPSKSIPDLNSIFNEIKSWARLNYEEDRENAKKLQEEEREKGRIADEQRRTEQEALKKQQQVAALQAVKTQCSNLLNDWGIDLEGAFKTYRYRDEDGGYICTMLAADKEGRGGAVLNDGKDTWSGSWKNAQISEVGDTLEIQIDDPEYRKQNLKERRFVIKYFDREQRVEWIDRIRILSAQA